MKFYPRFTLLALLFLSFFAVPVFGQTISITNNFDTTIPYSPGSTIAVPFHIDNASGCITQNNVFSLYLSNATGTTYSATPLATISGFYATFINATIPAGAAIGTGYKVKITASNNPAVVFGESGAFTITAGAAIKAGISSALTVDAAHPEVFGNCNASITNINFQDVSANATTQTATFFNESSQAVETSVAVTPTGGIGSFAPNKTNYTIIVKAGNGLVNGTKAYSLINNPSNSNFGFSGTQSVCLGSTLTFNIDITSPDGIQFNYPGNSYKFDWGDNSSTTLTFCDIFKLGGHVNHQYTTSSCGSVVGTVRNVFKISFEPSNPYCGSFNAVSTTAKISAPPNNVIAGSISACTGVPITFTNNSYPGEDPGSTQGNCIDYAGARYTWYVDGVAKVAGVTQGTAFTQTLTVGPHTIKLSLDNNPTSCSVADATFNVCVQDKPVPSFTLPAPTACLSAPTVTVPATNTTVANNSCYTNTYKWTVTGGTVAYAGGTNANSINPQFVFSAAGTYLINMTVRDACGNDIAATQKQIVINSSPGVTLSANTTLCGIQTLTFNATAGSVTRTVYTGTSDPTTATYQWTITGAGGILPATFANNTNTNQQYPQITFPDYGDYTVTVTHTNLCGTSSASQVITVKPAPVITANATPLIICEGTFTTLTGTVTGTYNSFQWIGGAGTFSPNRNVLNPTYTPTHAEFLAGTLTLALQANTSLPAPCNNPSIPVTLTLVPTASGTNATATICSGATLNYTPSASNTGSTFTWTANATIDISGYNSQSTPQTNPLINDNLVNASNVNSGTVTYTITPSSNGCPGTPFTYTVNVNPKPFLAPITDATICSGAQTNIVLNAIPAGTRYTFTVTGTAGASGFSPRTVASAGNIVQTLTNSGTTQVTVTYVITPISASGCPGAPVTAKVLVDPATTIATTTDKVFCGTAAPASTLLTGNVPLVGTGAWSQPAGQTAVIDNINEPKTTVSNLQSGQTYFFTWTITSGCGANGSTMKITVDAPSAGGTALAANGTDKLTVCSTQSTTITLTGNVGIVQRWEKSTDGGNTWATIVPGSITGNTYTFNNLLQNTSFRAVVLSGSCASANSAQVDVTVNPPTPTPIIISANPLTLCNQNTVTVTGSLPTGYSGQWVQVAGPTVGINIVSPASATTNITGLQGGNNYQFAWTINGVSPCSPSNQAIVTITNQAGIINTISYSGNIVCQGAIITLSNSAASGGNGLFTYKWENSIDGGNTWGIIPGETQPNINVTVGQKTMYRRTIASGQCDQVSNIITVDIQLAITNNLISSQSPEICFNTAPPSAITGNLPSGGDGINFVYQWQQSNNANSGFTDITGAVLQNYQPGILSVTTYFRRRVSSNTCSGGNSNTSNVFEIKVSPDIKANFSAQVTNGCAPFNINPVVNGTSNITVITDPNIKTYEWYANGLLLLSSSSAAFPGYSILNDGQMVDITLKVINQLGCSDSKTLSFVTGQQVTGNFTMTNITAAPGTACAGDQTIKFTNISNPLNGTTYIWSIDNVQKSTLVNMPNQTFVADANTGADKTYTITLTSPGCSFIQAQKTITVYPAIPVAVIAIDAITGCAPFDIRVHNRSLGTNITQYKYYLIGPDNVTVVNTITKTDKTDAVFAGINPTSIATYTIYMEATNNCNSTGKSQRLPITISPSIITERMTVNKTNGNVSGCAPFFTTFQNLSTGGTQYIYNIYRKSDFSTVKSIPISGNADANYNFDTPGEYYVKILVVNACLAGGSKESDPVFITVYPTPTPAFTTVGATSGCVELTANFKNTTPDLSPTSPASSFTYTWDFGDGSPQISGFTPPPHTYDYKKSPYTVTLSTISPTGCFASTKQTAIIRVDPPPLTDFTALPDTITTIPNYSFAFVDKTKNTPISWKWDFGDSKGSIAQNPSHTYADTGKYVVTLTTVTASGCTDSKTHMVRITGVPGQLYVPNAFMPTSLSQELRVFTVKGSGLKQYSLRIINNWGQVVFQTSKLDSKGEPTEFWDGKYKGVDAPQGVYAWEVTASFINGTEWKGMSFKGGTPKRAGTLTLIK